MREKYGLLLSSIDGGGLANAIPREAWAIVGIDSGKEAEFERRGGSIQRHDSCRIPACRR